MSHSNFSLKISSIPPSIPPSKIPSIPPSKEESKKKRISLLEMFTNKPNKNICLRKASEKKCGTFITRLGLVELQKNGTITNLSFKGGQILDVIKEGGVYYLRYNIYNPFMGFFRTRKTRLFVMSGDWKSYEPSLLKNGQPIRMPFFSPATVGKLSLHKRGEVYIVCDEKRKEFPICYQSGLACIKEGKKMVPLLAGLFIEPKIANMIRVVEHQAKHVEQDFNKTFADFAGLDKRLQSQLQNLGTPSLSLSFDDGEFIYDNTPLPDDGEFIYDKTPLSDDGVFNFEDDEDDKQPNSDNSEPSSFELP